VPEVEAGGGTIHDLSSERSLLGRVRAIRRLIRELDPALVHATLHEATIPAQIAGLGLPSRVLLTWANTSYTPEHFAGLEAPVFKMRLVQLADFTLSHLSGARFHAVTSGVGRVNRRNLRVRADRVYVGERGRDPQRFELDPASVEATRAGLGAPHGARFIL